MSEDTPEITPEEETERARAWLRGQHKAKREFIPEAHEEHLRGKEAEENEE